MENKSRKEALMIILSFGIGVFLVLMIFIINHYAPFGDKTIAFRDGTAQYLDFFAFYKDLLAGKETLGLSLNNSLGISNVLLFSYYLASPLNLLIIFFDKGNLPLFLDILFIFKIGLACSAFQYFLNVEFSQFLKSEKIQPKFISLFLSVGYGFSQYNFAQSCNVMWLDGLIFLPLILASISKLVKKKTFPIGLSFLVGLAILSNWYIAGMICLFTPFWLAYKISLNNIPLIGKRSGIIVGKYIPAMLLGIGLAAVLFLPTVLAVLQSSRGSLGQNSLELTGFYSLFPGLLNGEIIGSISSEGNPSLFCGYLSLLGLTTLLFNKDLSKKNKIITFSLLIFCVLILYYKPLVQIFHLLIPIKGYWYRYTFIVFFCLIYLSAYSLFRFPGITNLTILLSTICLIGTILVSIFILSGYQENGSHVVYIVLSLVLLLLTGFCLLLLKNKKAKSIYVLCFMSFLVGLEAIAEGGSVLTYYENFDWQSSSLSYYEKYFRDTQNAINQVKVENTGYYRILQLDPRNTGEGNYSTNYNEALAFDYFSINSYESASPTKILKFLDYLGYENFDDLCSIIDVCLLPVCSFLGVKFLLSNNIPLGTNKVHSISGYDDEGVYENPYAMPLGFKIRSNVNEEELSEQSLGDNPFINQNILYSLLLGKEISLYEWLDFEVIEDTSDAITIRIDTPEDAVAYGIIPVSALNTDTKLYINGEYQREYGSWFTPKIFELTKTGSVQIKITGTNLKFSTEQAQFVLLDLTTLEECFKQISEQSVKNLNIQNDFISFTVDNSQNDSDALVTIPNIQGINVTINGKGVKTRELMDTLVLISLQEGINTVEIRYTIPGLKVGLLISLTSIVSLVLAEFLRKRLTNYRVNNPR